MMDEETMSAVFHVAKLMATKHRYEAGYVWRYRPDIIRLRVKLERAERYMIRSLELSLYGEGTDGH